MRKNEVRLRIEHDEVNKHFTKIPNSIIKMNLKINYRMVLIYLFCNDSEFTITINWIAKELTMDFRSVKKIISDLDTLGIIKLNKETNVITINKDFINTSQLPSSSLTSIDTSQPTGKDTCSPTSITSSPTSIILGDQLDNNTNTILIENTNQQQEKNFNDLDSISNFDKVFEYIKSLPLCLNLTYEEFEIIVEKYNTNVSAKLIKDIPSIQVEYFKDKIEKYLIVNYK